MRQSLEDFSAKIEGRLTDQSAVEATVHLMISDVYHKFRMNDEGLFHAERASTAARSVWISRNIVEALAQGVDVEIVTYEG